LREKEPQTVMPRVLFVAVLLVASAVADVEDFSRYEVILSRKPFGKPPPRPSAANKKPAKPPAPPFTKDLKMCAITDTMYGVRVGIVNLAVKPARSYYLRVGESEDGITLLDADFESGAALLRKGSEEHWIYMSGKEGDGPPPAIADGSAVTAPVASTTRQEIRRKGYHLTRIRRAREALEAERKKETERNTRGVAELRKQIREYNMDLIRAKGELGPPLPLPLTTEEDEQLVAEGVLPVQE